MPLTDFQKIVVRVLRQFRTPHDYIGGGIALNKEWRRLSDDIDIFRDQRGQLEQHILPELQALRTEGFSVELTTSTDWMVEAILRRFDMETKIQWLDEEETSRRFFPAVEDDALGFRLHQADVALNKVLCASRRRTAARDAVDLLTIAENYVPLGPLIWALPGKDPSRAPPQILSDLRRIVLGYGETEINAVRMTEGVRPTRAAFREALSSAIDAASTYCEEAAPADYLGTLLIDASEKPVAANLDDVLFGRARSVQIKDFSALPRLVAEAP